MASRRASGVRFGDALDNKAASIAADRSDDVTDDAPDDEKGSPADVPTDTPSDMPTDMSSDRTGRLFASIRRADGRATTQFRSEKIAVLVTPDERSAIDEWVAGAMDAAGIARMTTSDVGRELFAELLTSPELTRTIVERVIARAR